VIAVALLTTACGQQGVSVSEKDPTRAGAVLFAERCSGCHTIAVAGTQGSGNRGLRNQGPNFDQRREKYADVLFAIRNGGFSGAIMPQNIVAGDDAKKVAAFLDKHSGKDVERPARPGQPQEQ
jgi:mono/diheme cytochrome c family protein